MSGIHFLACGSNPLGQLSLGDSRDVHQFATCAFHPSVADLIPSAKVVDLVSSSAHSLLLLETTAGNLLLGAGKNTLGQLGPRCKLWDEVKIESRFKAVDLLEPAGLSSEEWAPVKIACTWSTSFVVYERRAKRDEGVAGDVQEAEQLILACGSNDFGELGHEPTGEADGASDLPSIVDIGLKARERVQMIKGGPRRVLVLVNANSGQRLTGWGAARKGELDPTYTGGVVAEKGKGKGKAQAYSRTLPPSSLDISHDAISSEIIDFALGSSHTVVLLSDGMIRAWGSDNHGQIHDLSAMRNVKQIATAWNGTYLLTEDCRLFSQGSSDHGQLLRGMEANARAAVEIPGRVTKVVCGSEHLMIVSDGRLWVGGWNEHGNLGLGDQRDRSSLQEVVLPLHGAIRGVWGGCAASWIWIENGS